MLLFLGNGVDITVSGAHSIVKVSQADPTVSGETTASAYTMTQGTDYTMSYTPTGSNTGIEDRTVTVTITGIGKFSGQTKTVTYTQKADTACTTASTCTPSTSYTYSSYSVSYNGGAVACNAEPLKSKITVTADKTTTTKDVFCQESSTTENGVSITDFSVSYSPSGNNTGTSNRTVTGTVTHNGSTAGTFTFTQNSGSTCQATVTSTTYTYRIDAADFDACDSETTVTVYATPTYYYSDGKMSEGEETELSLFPLPTITYRLGTGTSVATASQNSTSSSRVWTVTASFRHNNSAHTASDTATQSAGPCNTGSTASTCMNIEYSVPVALSSSVIVSFKDNSGAIIASHTVPSTTGTTTKEICGLTNGKALTASCSDDTVTMSGGINFNFSAGTTEYITIQAPNSGPTGSTNYEYTFTNCYNDRQIALFASNATPSGSHTQYAMLSALDGTTATVRVNSTGGTSVNESSSNNWTTAYIGDSVKVYSVTTSNSSWSLLETITLTAEDRSFSYGDCSNTGTSDCTCSVTKIEVSPTSHTFTSDEDYEFTVTITDNDCSGCTDEFDVYNSSGVWQTRGASTFSLPNASGTYTIKSRDDNSKTCTVTTTKYTAPAPDPIYVMQKTSSDTSTSITFPGDTVSGSGYGYICCYSTKDGVKQSVTTSSDSAWLTVVENNDLPYDGANYNFKWSQTANDTTSKRTGKITITQSGSNKTVVWTIVQSAGAEADVTGTTTEYDIVISGTTTIEACAEVFPPYGVYGVYRTGITHTNGTATEWGSWSSGTLLTASQFTSTKSPTAVTKNTSSTQKTYTVIATGKTGTNYANIVSNTFTMTQAANCVTGGTHVNNLTINFPTEYGGRVGFTVTVNGTDITDTVVASTSLNYYKSGSVYEFSKPSASTVAPYSSIPLTFNTNDGDSVEVTCDTQGGYLDTYGGSFLSATTQTSNIGSYTSSGVRNMTITLIGADSCDCVVESVSGGIKDETLISGTYSDSITVRSGTSVTITGSVRTNDCSSCIGGFDIYNPNGAKMLKLATATSFTFDAEIEGTYTIKSQDNTSKTKELTVNFSGGTTPTGSTIPVGISVSFPTSQGGVVFEFNITVNGTNVNDSVTFSNNNAYFDGSTLYARNAMVTLITVNCNDGDIINASFYNGGVYTASTNNFYISTTCECENGCNGTYCYNIDGIVNNGDTIVSSGLSQSSISFQTNTNALDT